MQTLVTAKQMQLFDNNTINNIGIPALVLMERAALAVIEEIENHSSDLSKVAVICGYGNNGGDGVAIARLLKIKGIDVTVYLVGDASKVSAETEQQLKIARYYEIDILTEFPDKLTDYTTVIDALFGVGLTREVTGEFASAIKKINSSRRNVIAVDLPSGICSDSGQVMGIAVKANLTVTLAYQKLGLVFYPGADYAGKIITKDIGIYSNRFDLVQSLTPVDIIDYLPVRSNHANKGTFGKVLIIAGSEQMCGAAYFSAKAAYRCGAGLVKIYTPECNRNILFTQLPESLITTYDPKQIDEEILNKSIEWADIIMIGPGMGVSSLTKQILQQVLSHSHKNQPIVIDADALNVLAINLSLLNDHDRIIYVTPHLGEMSRLINKPIAEIQHNLIKTADQFATQHSVFCVMKDSRTIACSPEFKNIFVNQTGNSGMSTGGSGDVLSGMIASFLAQGVDPEFVAPVSVYLHGFAGDLAAKELGRYSLIADDIIHYLPKAISYFCK